LPVSFTRLRIAGFKSFAEPAVVEIRPGLTGIVGPNGCGKSNVVEALRWAMGEGSARSLRGGEMDDVIFAGTAARPSRNIAEVALVVDVAHQDGAQGAAPPPFHEAPELEVIRRLERGGGSSYRVNGREARARDVQTLFADLASGARSSAMVSQGRVGAIVAARPEERRLLLEEAAGITGLHARRHEADIKLRAAEANLGRAEDLKGQLEGQLESLKRQARQATRYRNISGNIRTAEADLFAIQRARVQAARDAAAAALHAARRAVADATAAATAASARAAEATAALPALRSAEGDARTVLERHRIGLEQVSAEAARAAAALAGAQQRAAQIASDLAHAEQLSRDAGQATARLAAEASRIAAEDEAHPPRMARAEADAAGAGDAARAAESEANRATEHAAEIAARHAALSEAVSREEQRARRLDEQVGKLRRERAGIAGVDPARLAAAEAERDGAERRLAEARARLEAAEQARATAIAAAATARAAAREAGEQTRRQAQAALGAARERAAASEGARAKVAAEAQALAEILAVKDGEKWPRMVDQLIVPAGLEAALGAALGEELESAADAAAARHWRALPPLEDPPALPAGATALATLVQAPAALARALSQVGLLEDGAAAQADLLPGQALVSRGGAVWRWDGYTIRAGTPTAAAARLQQRNRLADRRARLAEAEAEAAAARAALAAAEAAERSVRSETEAAEREARAAADGAERAATGAEAQARAERRDAEHSFERARTTCGTLAAQAASAGARLAAVDDQLSRLTSEAAEASSALRQAREARQALPDPAAARAAMERARAALAAARGRETAGRAERDALARAANGRAHRARTLAAEAADWRMRAADAAGRVTDLAARAAEARVALAALQAAPAEAAARRAAALDAAEAAELAHRRAAVTLQAAETEQAGADRAARAAEAALAAAREAVVRAEGEQVHADHAWGVVAERILERLGASPALPDPPADIGAEAEEKARRRLERLAREREDMGPVNLRAELEAKEVATQIDTILTERDELATAIAKLRGSIGHLNREGRERLASVFEQVDRNFQALFARNFGGGKAHLALVGSDDPLQAGLEIYAQPPGKKLSALSLLSGGEQALTALSLIFAVFRSNPAPVCVLDEVDAPLDDANVERFCGLLDDVVRDTGTRFLVVTHHPLTMARMDRLYGVTMQERGVSRLLSVDLRQAADLVEPQRIAAE
jgi:chromosome segregation protein